MFDRSLLPATVHGGNIQLQSGETAVVLAIQLGLLAPQVRAHVANGQPLAPNVLYRWQIANLWDLDKGHMPTPIEVVFRTGEEEPVPPEPVPTVTWADVEPIFLTHCALSGCHQNSQSPLGLDLSSKERVRETAVGVMSHQYYRSTVGPEGSAGLSRLSDLRIVDVVAGQGQPSRSYLMYKVVGDSHILGEPMPPPSAGHMPVSEAEQASIQAWIVAGAPTD